MSKIMQTKQTADKNIIFLTEVAKQYQEDYIPLSNKQKEERTNIIKLLTQLQPDEQQEWVRLMELKCMHLHKRQKLKQFKINIHKLIAICNETKIGYNEQLIQSMLKSIYFEQQGKDIVSLFTKAGYNTQQYQCLQYSPPWYSRLTSFFSD